MATRMGPKTKRPKTPNRGAADILARVIKKVKRMQNGFDFNFIPSHELIDWLRDWDNRAAKRKGGLGKK